VKIVFSERAWEDYPYWQGQDRKTLARIDHLIREVRRDPFAGIGKPEPLEHVLGGYWSRRITDEQRLVYKVQEDALWIAQVRYHY
jgi:toxin YoeB